MKKAIVIGASSGIGRALVPASAAVVHQGHRRRESG
jgi:NAD(P)-dependent dehydrogenase (short-subunit alcohol dehydrogenase family)